MRVTFRFLPNLRTFEDSIHIRLISLKTFSTVHRLPTVDLLPIKNINAKSKQTKLKRC